MVKRQREHRGLTHDELKSAALVCFRNARELLADAELLCAAKRHARTVFLSCIGLEELGKAALSLELYESNYQFNTDRKVKDFWKFWRNHLSKTAWGQGYLSFNSDVLDHVCPELLPKDYANWREYEGQKNEFYYRYSGLSTDIKGSSLYVDLIDREQYGEASGFHLPSSIFREEHAIRFVEELRARAKELSPRINGLGWLDTPPYPPDIDHHGFPGQAGE